MAKKNIVSFRVCRARKESKTTQIELATHLCLTNSGHLARLGNRKPKIISLCHRYAKLGCQGSCTGVSLSVWNVTTTLERKALLS